MNAPLVDAEGRVWVRSDARWRCESEAVGERWFVFSRDGVLTHSVRVGGMFLLGGEIGEDYLLDIIRDGLGVEGVRIVPLLREKGGES